MSDVLRGLSRFGWLGGRCFCVIYESVLGRLVWAGAYGAWVGRDFWLGRGRSWLAAFLYHCMLASKTDSRTFPCRTRKNIRDSSCGNTVTYSCHLSVLYLGM